MTSENDQYILRMIAECKQNSNMAAILTCLFKSFQWIPVLFINAVIVWSYYAYVLILCFGKAVNFVLSPSFLALNRRFHELEIWIMLVPYKVKICSLPVQ